MGLNYSSMLLIQASIAQGGIRPQDRYIRFIAGMNSTGKRRLAGSSAIETLRGVPAVPEFIKTGNQPTGQSHLKRRRGFLFLRRDSDVVSNVARPSTLVIPAQAGIL